MGGGGLAIVCFVWRLFCRWMDVGELKYISQTEIAAVGSGIAFCLLPGGCDGKPMPNQGVCHRSNELSNKL